MVRTETLDWDKQQKELDEMFDEGLERQYEDLPDVDMPEGLRDGGAGLFEHQVKGIKWMLKREIEPSMPPFYKEVTEGGQKVSGVVSVIVSTA